MALVLVMAAAIWGLGALMGAPRRQRGVALAVLWLAVVAAHLALPDGHALRAATGVTVAPWLLLGGIVAVIWAYGAGVGRLRARGAVAVASAAQGAPAGAEDGNGDGVKNQAGGNGGGKTFSDAELERYARHIVLHEIGGPGQKALRQARVLVIGAGGLGSPALLYLGACGVGTLGVIDDDVVENSNLARQVLHRDADIGQPKVRSAARALGAQNPFVTVRPYHRRLTGDIAADLFDDYDLILDGSDNFDTRYLANRVAVAQGKPLISGALSQWEGQLSVFDPARGGPCYRCLFPQAPAPGLAPSCAEAGVLSPLPGVMGAMMAAEAVKVITGAGTALRGAMLIYDALHGEMRRIELQARPDCPDCAGRGSG